MTFQFHHSWTSGWALKQTHISELSALKHHNILLMMSGVQAEAWLLSSCSIIQRESSECCFLHPSYQLLEIVTFFSFQSTVACTINITSFFVCDHSCFHLKLFLKHDLEQWTWEFSIYLLLVSKTIQSQQFYMPVIRSILEVKDCGMSCELGQIEHMPTKRKWFTCHLKGNKITNI